jgi:hypothetical protein
MMTPQNLADGLSVAASIIAVLNLAGKVVHYLNGAPQQGEQGEQDRSRS